VIAYPVLGDDVDIDDDDDAVITALEQRRAKARARGFAMVHRRRHQRVSITSGSARRFA